MKRLLASVIAAMLLAAMLTGGCSSADNPLTKAYRESLDRQAEQNKQMAKNTQEVAQSTKQLVESDAKSRREMIVHHANLQKELHAERQRLDQERMQIGDERRLLAQQQRMDPIIAEGVLLAGAWIVAALPCIVVIVLIRSLHVDKADEDLNTLIVHELASDRPKILPIGSLDLPSLPKPPSHKNSDLNQNTRLLEEPNEND